MTKEAYLAYEMSCYFFNESPIKSSNGVNVKQDEINVHISAECRHERDKNTQCTALIAFHVHLT